MLMFGNKRSKQMEVQRLLTKIMNSNCQAVDALHDGPRGEIRVNLTLPVIVVPMIDDKIELGRSFATVTKEVSSTGMSLVLTDHLCSDNVLLAVEVEQSTKYAKAVVRHQDPLGAGLLQAGVQLVEVVAESDHPELSQFKI
jgi:hypothetical protein